jgi:hypothetical protein
VVITILAQHGDNGGKCGVCGDNYAEEQPRAHEAGGKFANGAIGSEYISGQVFQYFVNLKKECFKMILIFKDY